jgi:hypothetical protein
MILRRHHQPPAPDAASLAFDAAGEALERAGIQATGGALMLRLADGTLQIASGGELLPGCPPPDGQPTPRWAAAAIGGAVQVFLEGGGGS